MGGEIGITVAEALTLPVLQTARLVAGQRGLSRVISRVNIMEVPDIFDWVHPGEFLLTTAYSIKDDPAAQLRLIPELARRGLSALGLKPWRYLGGIPQKLLQLAEEHDFPLIELPSEVSFADIMNPILTEVFNRQAATLQKAEEIHRRLFSVVLGGGGLDDIADTLAQILQKPVMIHDYLDDRQVASTRRAEKGEPTLTYTYPIQAGRRQLGFIAVEADEASISPLEQRAIEFSATVAALEVMKRESVLAVERRHHDDFVAALISPEPASRERAQLQAPFFHWDMKPPAVVLMISPKDPEKFFAVRKVQGPELNRIRQTLENLGKEYTASPLIGVLGDSLILVVPVNKKLGTRKVNEKMKELAYKILRELGKPGRDWQLTIGIGRLYEDGSETWKSGRDARKAIYLGQRAGLGKVIHFDDLGVYRLLSDKIPPEELNRFVAEFLTPLISYDREKNTELVTTLEVYFACGGNLKRVAEKLFTHYNTVLYRLQRISEITGIDLENAEQRLSLEIALKIRPLLEQDAVERV